MKSLTTILLLLIHCDGIKSFLIGRNPTRYTTFNQPVRQQSNLFSMDTDGHSEFKTVDDVITRMHESGYTFRIVVVGNGAILETTSKLGPTMKSSVSQKTGGRLITLASEDQSFEFHVKVDEVEDVVFAESVRPLEDGGEKTLRICRFMNRGGGSICSLILGESGNDAVTWFNGMKERFGNM